jgi:hypothetical protein
MEMFPVLTLREVSAAHSRSGLVEKRNVKNYVLGLKNLPPPPKKNILGIYDFRTENQIWELESQY